jgi:uncharacterized protein DUF5829
VRLSHLAVCALFAVRVQAADDLPAVFLSHFYVDLDKDTYHALQESPQVLSFADQELAHKTDGNSEYTGFYIRGRHTYMEFFGDPVPDGDRMGNVGLGLWVERTGAVAAINQRLRKAFGDQAKTASTTYPIGSETLPWYTATYVDENRSDDVLSVWIAETAPGYLAARHPGSPVAEPLSREQYLSWDFKPGLIFDDVIGLNLELSKQEATLLAKELTIVGWRVVYAAGGGYTATGPDVTVTVKLAKARGGLREVALRLRRTVPRQHFKIGSATLELDGARGRLIFAAPN